MKFVTYLRVSTQQQGQSGLGMEAQQVAVQALVGSKLGTIVAEFQEVESGRKGAASRPALMEALATCKRERAALVIGKLDRLARDVRFFLEVLDDSRVDIRFADLPDVNPKTDEGRMLLISMANFAEFEGRRIGTRTKAALAAAKARGVLLGVAGAANLRPNIKARQDASKAFALNLAPIIAGFKAEGLLQRQQIERLNALGIKTPTGRGAWSLTQLQRVSAKLTPA